MVVAWAADDGLMEQLGDFYCIRRRHRRRHVMPKRNMGNGGEEFIGIACVRAWISQSSRVESSRVDVCLSTSPDEESFLLNGVEGGIAFMDGVGFVGGMAGSVGIGDEQQLDSI